MSWNFDGISGWVGNAAGVPLTSANPATISCWARPDVVGSTLINISNSTGNVGAVRLIMISTGTRAVSINASNVASIADTTTGTPSVGVWGHHAATFTNAARSAFFNGANKVTTTASNVTGGFVRTQIGARRNASVTDNFFDGRIAEVGVWNVVLTDDEIASLGKGVSCALIRPQNLVLYAPMIRALSDYSRTLFSFSTINTGAAVDTLGVHPAIYF